jgi:excisionase family DNA binding protein
MQELLSAADAARILDVTPATVRQMLRRGTLPAAAKTEGGIHLFRRKDVEKLARAREQQRERTTKE